MRSLFTCLAAALAVSWFAGSAQAGYEFRFADAAGNYSNAFTFDTTVTPSIDIRVYLVQTGGDTGLSASGLDSGGVRLSYDANSVAKVLAAGDIAGNTAFDASNKEVGTTTGNTPGNTFAKLQVFQDGSAPVTAPTTGADANRILLGTFKFTGLSAGSSIVLTGDADPAPGFDDNVLGDGTVLDGLIANSQAVITVVVPEPGTVLLTGVMAGGMAYGAWRRRRQPA